MKSYTDIEQSKKLAEMLPLESADCYWEDDMSIEFGHGWHPQHVPCWSLSALISIIPQELFSGEYIINITEGVNHKWIISYDPPYDISSYLSVSNDSLIDCCVEIIIKLKERNLL